MTDSSTTPSRASFTEVIARTPLVPLALVLAALTLRLLSSLDSFYVGLGERYLDALARWSGGWLRPDVTHTLIGALIVIGGVIMWLGRLRPRQLGLEARGARGWLLALVATWCGFQLVLLAASVLGGAPRWHPHLPTRFDLQLLVFQVLVTGVVEEVFYRGFLLPQLYRRLVQVQTPGRALATAIALLSVVFALLHLPVRLAEPGMDAAALARTLWALAWMSALFAWIYVRSGNLLVAAAVHAVRNAPTPLLTTSADEVLTSQLRWVVMVGAALCFVFYPRVLRPRPPEE